LRLRCNNWELRRQKFEITLNWGAAVLRPYENVGTLAAAEGTMRDAIERGARR